MFAFTSVFVTGIRGAQVTVIAIFRFVLAHTGQRHAVIRGARIAVIAILGRGFAFPVVAFVRGAFVTVVTITIGLAGLAITGVDRRVNAPHTRHAFILRTGVGILAHPRLMFAFAAGRVTTVQGTDIAVGTILFPVSTLARFLVTNIIGALIVVITGHGCVQALPCERIAFVLGTWIAIIAVLGFVFAFTRFGVATVRGTQIIVIAVFRRMGAFTGTVTTVVLGAGIAILAILGSVNA